MIKKNSTLKCINDTGWGDYYTLGEYYFQEYDHEQPRPISVFLGKCHPSISATSDFEFVCEPLEDKLENGETQYLNALQHILDSGITKENRTGINTITAPPLFIQHDMRDGFPLITTKKMALKTMLVELEGFIKGITDKRWFQDRGCKIWNEWCNPGAIPGGLKDDARKEFQADERDLGPIYGHQWRRYNKEYWGMNTEAFPPLYDDPSDQLAKIIHTLKTNPDDRRMLCMAWNPLALNEQALPACHLGFNIQHIDGVLHLSWFQRSADMFLGVPFNLSSYAALLLLICEHTGMEAGTVSGTFVDAHIYENQIQQCIEQLSRKQRPLPTVRFNKPVDIFEWDYRDLEVVGYDPHGAIKADVAI